MADTQDNTAYVNAQVVDAVMATSGCVIGNANSQSQAVVYEALAHSLMLIMHNAGATQYGSQQVSAAATAKACAAILKTAE